METKIETEKRFMGSILLKPGQSLFEICHDTLEVNMVTAEYGENGRKGIVTRQRHWYVPALNKDNAIRKYTKMMLKLMNDSLKSKNEKG